MAVLVNGDAFKPVTAQMDADFYTGLWGMDLSVMAVGGNMAATIVSATTVRIADGEAIIQGRRIHINAGSYDEFTIPTGEQGVTKYYVIGYELYRDNEKSKEDESGPMQKSTSGIVNCKIAKNRHGDTKTVQLHWDGQYTRFSSVGYLQNEQ